MTARELLVIKFALRWLAACVDETDEAMSDAAADIYREWWGEDHNEDTFNRKVLAR